MKTIYFKKSLQILHEFMRFFNRYFSKFEPLEYDLKDLESQLHQWLGSSPVKEVRLALVTREQGGAYNRAGLIVLPDK